jgi:hypothetical protein
MAVDHHDVTERDGDRYCRRGGLGTLEESGLSMIDNVVTRKQRRLGGRSMHGATLVTLIQVFSVLGCTAGNDAEDQVVEDVQPPIDSKKAIAIARKHLEKLGGRPLGKTKAEAEQIDSWWSVTITRLPTMPVGFTIVRVNAEGKVTTIIGGE